MKFLLPVVLLLAMSTTPSLAGSQIQEIVDAGLNGCIDVMPDSVGKRFVKFVEDKCIDKDQCEFQARTAGPKWGCENFFVIYNCGGKNREFHSENIRDAVTLRCD